MNAPARLGAFAGVLAALFGGGALAGGALDPDRSPTGADAAPHGAEEQPDHGGGAQAEHPVRGVAVAENALRLVVDDPELRRGRTKNVRFRIVESSGDTVRDFDVEHTERMHVIVVRRDLTGFMHLHPRQDADGAWSLALKLDAAGSYRLFADFSHEDERTTLAADLRVDGTADLRPLAAPAPAAISDGGYDVRLDAGRLEPGEEADLRFTVSKDGRVVSTEPYLGAGGHLVALREGDLAFLHVHPTDGDHAAQAADGVGFAATFPTQGRYRLFLQFKHEGRVQTAAFTQEVS
ncbi:MAG: hypothetical protein ACLGI5_15670 [Thermoleophilia bacterium]